MYIATRPSAFYWLTAAGAALCIAFMVWVPILFLTVWYFPPEERLLVSGLGTLPVLIALLPLALRSARAACWAVDFDGLTSPSFGRISFAEVASLHAGFPREEAVSMIVFDALVRGGLHSYIDQTLILRLSDGRLLPLNLTSPSIHGGSAVMAKLAELLAGKQQPSTTFSKAEIAALKKRPLNRIVVPKNA